MGVDIQGYSTTPSLLADYICKIQSCCTEGRILERLSHALRSPVSWLWWTRHKICISSDTTAVKYSPLHKLKVLVLYTSHDLLGLLSPTGPLNPLAGHTVIGRENPSCSFLTTHMVPSFQNFTLAFERSSLEAKNAKEIISYLFSKSPPYSAPSPTLLKWGRGNGAQTQKTARYSCSTLRQS